MSEYMSITPKFGGLDNPYLHKILSSHPPGIEDTELIIDSVHFSTEKIPFYEQELTFRQPSYKAPIE